MPSLVILTKKKFVIYFVVSTIFSYFAVQMEEKEKKKLSFRDFETYQSNPSFEKKLGSIGIAQIVIDENTLQLVDESDGSIYRQFSIVGKNKKMVADNKKFIKVYFDCFDRLNELSNSGVRVLTYIWTVLKSDCHEFYIDIDDATKKCGYQKSTSIYTGLLDLLDKKMIFKATGNHRYFVNVEMFFNGLRTKLPPLVRLQEKLDGK